MFSLCTVTNSCVFDVISTADKHEELSQKRKPKESATVLHGVPTKVAGQGILSKCTVQYIACHFFQIKTLD